MFPEVTDLDDWVAVAQLVDGQVLAVELVGISRFHVSSMVLVEVIQLIVHIYWSFDLLFNWSKFDFTQFIFLKFGLAIWVLVVLCGALEDLLTQHVEYNSDGEENYTENTEGKHCAHCCGNWSPGGQRLLLKLGLFQLFNLFTDSLLLVRIDEIGRAHV